MYLEGGGEKGVRTPSPWENLQWLQVSLEILVRVPLEKQLDPGGVRTTNCDVDKKT